MLRPYASTPPLAGPRPEYVKTPMQVPRLWRGHAPNMLNPHARTPPMAGPRPERLQR
jgi:hypothetical protein